MLCTLGGTPTPREGARGLPIGRTKVFTGAEDIMGAAATAAWSLGGADGAGMHGRSSRVTVGAVTSVGGAQAPAVAVTAQAVAGAASQIRMIES